MSLNLDIALDEVRKLSVAGEFLEFLVKKTHEFFGAEETSGEPEVTVEPVTSSLADTDTDPGTSELPAETETVGQVEAEPDTATDQSQAN